MPTVGFHPVIAPASEAKMNTAGLLAVPSVTIKSVVLPVPLNTCPVGESPGMVTLKGWVIGLPLTSPPYTSLRPPPLDETQKPPPLGLREMPQAFVKVGSVVGAIPGWSEIRSVARNTVLGLHRCSRDSIDGMHRGRRALFSG